ncbi:MAG: UPF0182 family protein [Chloroflexota bacterium]|nr:UPF0182 family protein [Chloroflexota bacterium]
MSRDTPNGTPRPIRPVRSQTRRSRARLWWTLAGIVLALLIIPSLLAEMLTDWMWFGSQGLAPVYTTQLFLRLEVFFGGGLIAAIFCYFNWRLAWRATRPNIVYPGQREPVSPGFAMSILIGSAIAIGIFMGLIAAERWSTILLFLNGGQFGQTDPLFNNDIGFYVFTMPFFKSLRGWGLLLLIIAGLGAAVIYLIGILPSINRQIADAGSATPGQPPRPFMPRINLGALTEIHLSILGALFLLIIAFGYWLSTFDLLYSSRSVAYGAGYTDTHAKLPSLYIMMVVAVLSAVLLVVNTRVRAWKLMAGAVGVWLLALIVVGGIYPFIVQQFVVKPSELSLETPYIQNNIAATRRAFNLDNFQEREVPAVESITQSQVASNTNTINNIRLWDYRPLLDTYSQLQEIRSYYQFDGVDIDRYNLGGKLTQVMLSARELSAGSLNEAVRTWQNQHFVYTHGYGAVVSPVNQIEGEGLPTLLVKNIPPETNVPELKITRPEIYFGEQSDEYIFVNSSTQEFDYPVGDSNKYTTYAGKGGVQMDSFFAKLLFSARFGDTNMLLSDYITPQTRVMFHRNIHDSLPLIAPFLQYDHDPYLVIADGKLYWMQDAYTTSSRYPYSSPSGAGVNYIRNSVKVVVDAYDGKSTFYVSDPTDPLIRAYRGIFPTLFHDMSEMPASLRSHVRYPEDLMNVQASTYAIFHMTDPRVFYQKEDVWNVPAGTQNENSVPLEAYYVNMQIPGESTEGFSLIQPFTPAGKSNMIAWMAAKNDGADYGKVDVIRYPKQQLVYGPGQIEARIDQDPLISQQLTLWNQSGSKVIRGNLLVIPISSSVLYVEPLFLQATASSFPELKRVIVATGNQVGIGSNLKEALDVAFNLAPGQVIGAGNGSSTGTGSNATPGQTPQPGATRTTRSASDIAQSQQQHYQSAQDALKRSDWTTYGREIDALKADIDALVSLEGIFTPSPAITPPVTTPQAGITPASAP